MQTEQISYEAAVEYALQIPRFTKKNTPADTAAFYAFLGKPGSRSSIIHIAGTNGKGSVCAYLNSCLLQAGCRVGMFTSPHLVDIRERFRIQGRPVSREAFTEGFRKVMAGVEAFQKENRRSYHPTFFEMMFLIAMVVFEREGVEYIVLETGLGGRLDATNVIEHPVLTVITKIAFDHMEYLGNTLGQIAAEKAGILKPGAPVVFWKGGAEETSVIVRKAKEMGISCISVSDADVDFFRFEKNNVDFSIQSEYYGYIRCRLHTAAAYQKQNAALAVRALECLKDRTGLTRGLLEAGLEAARWEARMEEIAPEVYLDGAHNEDGMRAFLESVAMLAGEEKASLLFCAVSDKKADRLAEMIGESGYFDRVWLAPVQNGRSLGKEALEALFQPFDTIEKHSFSRVGEAMEDVWRQRRSGRKLFIAGSLYLAGEVKQWIEETQEGNP